MGIPLDHFFTKVDENLVCPICREVLRNPVSCRDGHTFCEACVVEWLARHANCPMDRRPLAKRELIRNLPVGGLIENLDVRCVNADVGAKAKARNASSPSPSRKRFGAACTCTCTWRGKARNLDDHVRECPYANVSCPHPLCGDVMLRKFVDAHARTCPERSVSCHACALEMAACDLDEHIEHDCPLAMVPCINGCLTDGTVTMVSRVHMQDHVCHECGNALVSCPFESQGCTVRAARSELDHHVETSVKEHMLLLAKENKSLREKISVLNEHVKSEISALRDELPNAYTWNVANFQQYIYLPVGEEIQSPRFWLCGICWKLRLYPNGASAEQSSSMSLYLERQSDQQGATPLTTVSNAVVSILFRFIVVSPSDDFADYIVSIDQPFSFMREDKDWGWGAFMRTDQVRTYYTDDGTLKIKCVLQLKS
ncbi:TNF receptor-associated factor 4-like isoform X1 [Oscarella lobularis]|uniref:TNF receptor-associated factor 4-like isoform X1 n=1 Tax=Oscarella lobularis TaxID=121494 RepID=UPI0033133A29